MEKKNWIQDAVKHKGALRKQAKREHLIKGDEKLSMTDLNKLEKKGGKTAKRAQLAKTLRKFYGGGRILEWADGNAEKLIQKYLGVKGNEVFNQSELINKGDYYIGSESSGDGDTVFIDVCFGDKFEENINFVEKNYEHFTRYAEDISDNMNYDVTVMSNSDANTIMFQFTDWFPEESEEPNDYANGGMTAKGTEMVNTLTQIESDFKSFKPNVPFLPLYLIPFHKINKHNSIVTAEYYDGDGKKQPGFGEAQKYFFSVPHYPGMRFTILKESHLQELKNQLIDWAKNFYWYPNVELSFNYEDENWGTSKGGRIYKFNIKVISIPKIEPKIEKAEPKEEQTWTITYSTENDNTDRVWVYGRNKDEAIENAKDEYWDIKEIISVEKNMALGGEIEWGEDLGDGFSVGNDVYITDSKSMYQGKTGFVSGLIGKDLLVTLSENGNERNVFVSKKGVEKLDAPEFAKGGKVIGGQIPKEGDVVKGFGHKYSTPIFEVNEKNKTFKIDSPNYWDFDDVLISFDKVVYNDDDNEWVKQMEEGGYTPRKKESKFKAPSLDEIRKWSDDELTDLRWASEKLSQNRGENAMMIQNWFNTLNKRVNMIRLERGMKDYANGGKVDFMSDEFESKVNDIFAKPKSTPTQKILPSTNRTKNAFGSLSFEQLSEIFNVELFGLNERETEKMLEELRDEWNLMSENERIGFLNANGIKFAYGGMTPGRYYQDNKGQEFRFVGESEGKLLFKDGENVISKSEEDFEDIPQEKKLFKFFRLGGEMAEPEESQEYYASMQYAEGGRIKVGTFNEEQLINKEDKKAVEKAREETGLKYVDTKIIKKGGNMYMEVYLIPNEEYYNSSKFAKGGEVSEKYNLHFNYNPSNLSNKDAEKIVEKYTKDWKHNNDFDEVSFYVMGLSKSDSNDLRKELKMEDTYNIEVDKSSYAKGGTILDLKDVYNELRSKVGRLEINEETKDNISCDIRHWGNWEHDYEDYDRDEEDFEDDDDMILSRESSMKMSNIVKEVTANYPSASISWNTSEKNYIDFQISRKMAKGGTFDSKVNAIAKKLEGKPVPAPYRKEYGNRYDKEDAKEAATRIVGNMRKMYGE